MFWGDKQGNLTERALDLATLLPAPKNYQWSDLWADPVHPVWGGNKIIAEKIYDKLVKNAWLPTFEELPLLTIIDSDNNGAWKGELRISPDLVNHVDLNLNYTWLFQGQPIGVGWKILTPLKVGESKIDLRVQADEGEPIYFRQVVNVKNNLSTIL